MGVVEEVLAAYERGWVDALKSRADIAPAGELVSREAAMDAIRNVETIAGRFTSSDTKKLAIESIRALPPVARVPVAARQLAEDEVNANFSGVLNECQVEVIVEMVLRHCGSVTSASATPTVEEKDENLI